MSIYWQRHRAIRIVKRLVRSRLEAGRDHARTIVLFASIGLILSMPGHSNPEGGIVVAGSAEITGDGITGTTIHQASDKVIINWQDFSIGAAETVEFLQPSTTAIALNRIIGENPSIIMGRLSANGQIILINPNGLLFGSGSQVDVGSLIATTHDIDNQGFLQGRYIFDKQGSPTAMVANEGTITASESGLVAFVAPAVRNSGLIVARLGHVEIGASSSFTLDFYGDEMISFPVDAAVVETALDANGDPVVSLVNIDGKILSEGGTVILSANDARSIVDNVISIGGEIKASGYEVSGGVIRLNGGTSGRVEVGGALDASGTAGGEISIVGDVISVTADLRALGANGDGGSVSIYSRTQTDFSGSINVSPGEEQGSGGLVEVSSAGTLTFAGTVVTGIDDRQGALFLDPKDMTVVADGTAGAGETEVSAISDVLETGTAVSLLASNDFALKTDLSVENVSGNGGNLTIAAGRHVILDGDISTDNGDLTIIANQYLADGVIDTDRDPGASTFEMKPGVAIDAGSGVVVLKIVAGDDKTYTSSGALTLGTVSGSTITALNEGPDDGDVVINGTLTATGTGDSIIVGGSGNFINNAGASSLVPGPGRYLVYSADPDLDTAGGLTGAPVYDTEYGATPDASFTGDRFLHALAPVLLVSADNQSRDYGDANPALTVAVTGYVGGDDPGLASSGSASLSTAAAPGSDTGEYTITTEQGSLVSDYNYSFAFADGTLTIDPATLTITADDDVRIYGDANPDFTGIITGYKNGEDESVITGSAAYTTAATSTSDVGDYTISTNVDGMSATNYIFDAVDGTLAIDPATLTITADDDAGIYGDANPDFTGVIAGYKNGEDESVITGSAAYTTAATLTSDIGGYTISTNVEGMSSTNYIFDTVDGTLTIDPAILTVTADSDDRIYGDPNPVLTGVITGYKNGEDKSVVAGDALYSTVATLTSNVGDYVIATNVEGMSATNYVFDAVNGTLTIDPAVLTVAAVDKARIYGDPNPEFTGVIAGYKNGEDESVITGSAVYSTAANLTSNIGDYTISTNVDDMSATNYVFDAVDGILTIVPALLITVAADDVTRLYGDTNPEFTGQITGFKNGEDESVIDGSPVYSTTATLTTNVGDYTISTSVDEMSATNYVFAAVDGTLTIDPATLTVTASDGTRIYGDPNPAFTGTITGYKNNENGSVITGIAAFSTPAILTSNVGDYTIATNVGGMSATNYIFESVDGVLTIDPAELTAVADDRLRLVGDPNPDLFGVVTGFKNGEDVSVISGLTYVGDADETTVPGDYAIFPTGGTATNYIITVRRNGVLTVLPLDEANRIIGETGGSESEEEDDDDEGGSSGGLGGDSDPGSPFGNPLRDFEPEDGNEGSSADEILCWLGFTNEDC